MFCTDEHHKYYGFRRQLKGTKLEQRKTVNSNPVEGTITRRTLFRTPINPRKQYFTVLCNTWV